jgi:hypothetical protein
MYTPFLFNELLLKATFDYWTAAYYPALYYARYL